jgi:hypothetical protein
MGKLANKNKVPGSIDTWKFFGLAIVPSLFKDIHFSVFSKVHIAQS